MTMAVRWVGPPIESAASCGTDRLTKNPNRRSTQATAANTASSTNNAHSAEVRESAGPRNNPPENPKITTPTHSAAVVKKRTLRAATGRSHSHLARWRIGCCYFSRSSGVTNTSGNPQFQNGKLPMVSTV